MNSMVSLFIVCTVVRVVLRIFSGAELTQWLSQAEALSQGNDSFAKNHCKTINNLLRNRSYLVGNNLTVADAAILHSLSNRAGAIAELPELKRYLDHISRLCTGVGLNANISPTVFPIRTRASSSKKADAAAVSSAASAPAASNDEKTAAVSEAATAKAAPGAADGAPKAEDGKKAKKEKQPAPAAAAASAGGDGDGPAEAADLDPSKVRQRNDALVLFLHSKVVFAFIGQLDIRVGVIIKCWNHPDSDKLYCEVPTQQLVPL
jgi:tRNA-binding EMAP/Myf-like protein